MSQVESLTKEQFDGWKRHPITEHIMEILKAKREHGRDEIRHLIVHNREQGIALSGYLDGLEELLNISFGDVDTNE